MVTIINKRFVEDYREAISGKAKTPELINRYVSDPELLEHIAFFEAAFPKYELFADDYVCEDDKVAVRGRFRGVHKGEIMGMPPTNRTVEFPFAIIYRVTDEKISKSWLFADMMAIRKQLEVNPNLN
ncbi:ester cyclase [Winogradskyella alexanderae]|uniref:Ester cyclase n=1 Tax=Winogradskyella alexanderae TaxID=2877123 RepID=A0ABS7XRW9_9FLAO|nr:ester cyclase [Winogradskyella alexanderae]MCA0132753.1 ester cyclase [Winogradskyella alexanderae]